ncbi:MAG: alpha/beta hydrolase [Alphaproteobacteria bacterium]
MRHLKFVLLVATAAYLAAAGYLYAFQRGFVFKPSGELTSPADEGLIGVTVEHVAMADGVMVPVWHRPPARPDLPTVLYFHGNSGTLSGRAERFSIILESGFGLYAPGYRGYAGANGTPSEAAFVADALVHFDRLSATVDTVVIHGESLGTGVAAAVAEQRDAAALILEAPYTAAVDIAAASYPWLPVSILMRDQFRTRERIAGVTEPVLIVHGSDDVLIPVAHGKAIYALAGEPKDLAILGGVGHSELWPNGLWARALMFLTKKGVLAAGN